MEEMGELFFHSPTRLGGQQKCDERYKAKEVRTWNPHLLFLILKFLRLQRPLRFAVLVAFDHIAYLHVVEAVDADTAVEA